MKATVYYLFLTPNMTDTNAIIDYFTEVSEVTVDWELSKRKVTVTTEDTLDLLEIFKTLGIGNVEYYEESGDLIRNHGQYIAEKHAIVVQTTIPMFAAGYNF